MDEFTESPPSNLLPTDRLSERQKQCLELVAKGHTSKEIGRILGLSPSTVDNHLSIVLERLGVESRVAAAKLFISSNQIIKFSDIPVADDQNRHRANFIAPNYGQDNANHRGHLMKSLFSIPPVGGQDNRLSQRRRYYHVIQIMLLALVAFSAVTITIAGIVHLFSK